MTTHRIHSEMVVDRPIDEVFAFFSGPENATADGDLPNRRRGEGGGRCASVPRVSSGRPVWVPLTGNETAPTEELPRALRCEIRWKVPCSIPHLLPRLRRYRNRSSGRSSVESSASSGVASGGESSGTSVGAITKVRPAA